MTQQIKYFCDTCGKECLPSEGLGTFAGFIAKITSKLEKHQHKFAGDYCFECSEVILNFIVALKKDISKKVKVNKNS